MTARVGLCWVLMVAGAGAEDGRVLAERACAACHVFPEPGLLDRESWRVGVLPKMGDLLGGDGVPLGSAEGWGSIVAYYLAAAPEKLEVGGGRAVELGVPWFEVERLEGRRPATTAVAVDEGAQLIVVGDATSKGLVVYSEELEVVGEVALGGVPVEVRVEGEGRYLVTVIGGEVWPNEKAEGKVVRVSPGGEVDVLVEGLARPVSARVEGEGLVVCCFGFKTGGVERIRGNVREVLVGRAGGMGFSRDGGLVLMAQGDEGVVRLADGVSVLRFPPSYGVSSMTEGDLDGDGDLDLVVTAGDNADDTPVFKPYHGVYVFENDGEGGYGEAGFYPMHGAYGAVAGDFDGDGDLDLGAVAFFADYAGGEEGFVVLENLQKWKFRARTVVGLGGRGRFAVVAAGDVDGDDDVDVVLGNYPGGPNGPGGGDAALVGRWMAGGRGVVLRNLTED